ncbi:MAG: YdcF family protein [Neisseria sp.]|nr:YdcF family protein [Neisseria sp.]
MNRRPSFFRRLRSALGSLLLFVLMIYIAVAVWILYSGQPREAAPADAAIILGAAAWGDKPSPVFMERIRHAVNLYHAGTVKKLIFTGGTPKAGFATEAEVGARWAMKNGVPAQDILLDKTSRNTLENLRNAAQLARLNKLYTFVVVSDPYHMARASLMAHDVQLNAQMSPTPTSRFNTADVFTKVKFFHQECYNFLSYGLFSLFERRPLPDSKP